VSSDFYRAFEDRYRGSRQLIKDRLKVYTPFITPLLEFDNTLETFDLGCGRGEWLELTQELGFNSKGIDLDEGMILACRELGLNAKQGEAYPDLKSLKDNSQAVISAFHVVEHISFEELQKWTKEALRVLKPGGLLIYETPNPENILVATHDFYLDPTHIKPIPPKLLSFIVEHAGFQRVKTVRLQEDKDIESIEDVTIENVFSSVSPDYAVIAQKNAPKEILEATSQVFELEYGIKSEFFNSRFEARIEKIGNKASQTLAASDLAEVKASQALAASDLAEVKASQALAASEKAMVLATETLKSLNAIYASKSWKITAPLRWISLQYRLLFEQGPKARAKNFVKKCFHYLIRVLIKRRKIKEIGIKLLKKTKLGRRVENFYFGRKNNNSLEELNNSPLNQNILNLNEDAQKVYLDMKNFLNTKGEPDANSH
jgi:O-antigen chain-terminating methyltransferase